MARKPRDTSQKRNAILDAAIDVFIENGYERASMDLIATAANSSKRTVYNHFPSKEALIEKAFNRFLEEAYEAKNIEYDPETSIEKQLGEFAESKMMLTRDPKRLGLMRVTLGVFITHPHMAERAIQFSDSHEDSLAIWLKAADKDGRLKVKNPKLAAEAFWSLFAGTFFWPPVLEGPVEEKREKKLKKAFIELFLAQYKA